jgi:Leucine-rich repeat (LRR) protein
MSLNMSANGLKGAEAGKALGDALAANTVLKGLDLSGGKDKYGNPIPNMDIAFVKAFTPGLSDNGTLTSLNVANNRIGEYRVFNDDIPNSFAVSGKGAYERLGKAFASHTVICSHDIFAGAITLVNAITNMGALTSLNMSSNGLLSEEGGTLLGEMLKGNTRLKELDVSSSGESMPLDAPSNTDGSRFAKELAVGIKDNGALTKFDISSNNIRAEGGKAVAAGLQGNQVITELNISGNDLGLGYNSDNSEVADTSGVTALADTIPGMGALLLLNISNNHLVGENKTGRYTEKTYDSDGDTDDEAEEITEPDFSGVIALADGSKNNETLTTLDMSNNNIGQLVLPEGWSTCYYPAYTGDDKYKHTDGRKQANAPEGSCAGIIALASAIPDMRALLKIDLSRNKIDSDGIKTLLQRVQEWDGWEQMDGFNLGGNPGAKFLVHPCRSFMLHDPSCWIISQALPISVATAGGWKAVQQSLIGDLCCKRGRKAAMIRWIVVLGCIVALLLPQYWTAGALQGGVYWHNTTTVTSHLHQEQEQVMFSGTKSAAWAFDACFLVYTASQHHQS